MPQIVPDSKGRVCLWLLDAVLSLSGLPGAANVETVKSTCVCACVFGDGWMCLRGGQGKLYIKTGGIQADTQGEAGISKHWVVVAAVAGCCHTHPDKHAHTQTCHRFVNMTKPHPGTAGLRIAVLSVQRLSFDGAFHYTSEVGYSELRAFRLRHRKCFLKVEISGCKSWRNFENPELGIQYGRLLYQQSRNCSFHCLLVTFFAFQSCTDSIVQCLPAHMLFVCFYAQTIIKCAVMSRYELTMLRRTTDASILLFRPTNGTLSTRMRRHT